MRKLAHELDEVDFDYIGTTHVRLTPEEKRACGKRLRAIRLREGLSPLEMSQRLWEGGAMNDSYARYERGTGGSVNVIAGRLKAQFGVDPRWFLTGKGAAEGFAADPAVSPSGGDWQGAVVGKHQQYSTRVRAALRDLGCETLADASKRTRSDFARVPNVGRGTIAEIETALLEVGLMFAGEGPVDMRRRSASIRQRLTKRDFDAICEALNFRLSAGPSATRDSALASEDFSRALRKIEKMR